LKIYTAHSATPLIRCVHYTVSQKNLWLAITLTHMNGFWYFLAKMLLIK